MYVGVYVCVYLCDWAARAGALAYEIHFHFTYATSRGNKLHTLVTPATELACRHTNYFITRGLKPLPPPSSPFLLYLSTKGLYRESREFLALACFPPDRSRLLLVYVAGPQLFLRENYLRVSAGRSISSFNRVKNWLGYFYQISGKSGITVLESHGRR